MPAQPKKITLIYDWGQVFYVITDCDRKPRMLTGVKITPHGMLYLLTCGTETHEFYEFELSETVPDKPPHLISDVDE